MNIVDPAVEHYLERLLPSPHPVLREMEALAKERRFPIIGPQVGRLFHFIASATSAHRVFEMGSGFGYSTLWFALAAGDAGRVHHTDGSEENSRLARDFLERAGVLRRVTFHVGDAVAAYRSTPGEFDAVFVDVDKAGYPEAFREIRERQRPGQLLLVDNLIWHGRVIGSERDPDTEGVREITRAVFSDDRYEATVIPVRDGVLLARRVRA